MNLSLKRFIKKHQISILAFLFFAPVFWLICGGGAIGFVLGLIPSASLWGTVFAVEFMCNHLKKPR